MVVKIQFISEDNHNYIINFTVYTTALLILPNDLVAKIMN